MIFRYDYSKWREFRLAVQKMMLKWTSRERGILIMRFGLEDGVTHTLEEVGKEFSVTRERIRQIENKALSRLKNEIDL